MLPTLKITLGAARDATSRPMVLIAAALGLTALQLMLRATADIIVARVAALPGWPNAAYTAQLALLGGLALLVFTVALSVLGGAAVAAVGRTAMAAPLRHGTAFATIGVLSASGVALATLLDLAALVAIARAGLLWSRPGWSTLVTTLVGLPAALCALLFAYSGILASARLARRDPALGSPLDGLLELGAALLVVLRAPWRTMTVASAVGVVTSPLIIAALVVGPATLAEPLSWSTSVLHLFVGLCLAATIVCAGLAFDRALPESCTPEYPRVRLPAGGGPDSGG